MKLCTLWLVVLVCCTGVPVAGSNSPIIPVTCPAFSTDPGSNFSAVSSLTIKKVQQLIGRKLTLKEKIVFKIAQWKIKNAIPKDEGGTSQTLAIIAAICLFIPFVNLIAPIPLSIMAISIGRRAKKADPHNKKARRGVTLGIIVLSVFVITITIIIAVLASGGLGL